MWADEVKRLLHEDGEDAFYDVRYYESVDSTNEVVKRAAAEGAKEGLVVIGEEQTAGKGRLGRSWASPKGEAVYFSFLLRPELPAKHASALTLVMGLSVAQAVGELYPLAVWIKWPNDVVINGKKICGILTEAQLTGNSPILDYAIVGTGINVNNTAFPSELADRATSLRLELGKDASRAHVLALSLRLFHRNYETYKKSENLSGLISDYNYLLIDRGKRVRVEDPAGPYIAMSRGIDEEGRLLVEMEDGSVRKISTGEVSVRGLYGYV